MCFCMVMVLLVTALLTLPSCEEDAPEVNTYPLQGGGQPEAPNDPDTPSRKRVAITFDDGPHTVYTQMIANELERYGFTATFFVVGNRVDGSAYTKNNIVHFLHQKGQEIAIHGYTHDVYYDRCAEDVYRYELSQTAAVIKAQAPDAEIKLMRPIGGNINQARIEACPYAVVKWNVDSEDWKYKYKSGDTEAERKQKLDTIVNNVMNQVSDGSIILMHDIYESTYDAACIILKQLYDAGYEVVSVTELLGTPQPGTLYNKRP